MFTGIIEGLGTLAAVRSAGQGKRLAIEAGFSLNSTKIGDSIAVNGACLTAVVIAGSRFEVDAAPETLQRTILGQAKIGDKVNLERALRLSDRLDGHLVSGHVDGIGTISNRTPLANAIIITVTVPSSLTRYMIEKGSVAVDGVSLTINKVGPDFFEVSIIPHTAGLTTVGAKKPGASVNIETDLIGKYIEKFMQTPASSEGVPKKSNIDMAFLAKSGFL
jgi:riboflavin synthase